jgi:hypothetical protein
MKTCSKCKIEKPKTEFQKQSCKADGLRYHCKVCRAIKAHNHYSVNKIDILAKNYKYAKKRLETDINFKLARNLRCRLNKALKSKNKNGSAIQDLGCSIEELRLYLESLWQPGMTWENNTYIGWHVDHIRPLCSFILTDPIQLKEACHYTNLQPLWYNDNMKKSGKYDK